MEFENLIRLVEAVSNSSLTGFKYEENGVKLNLSKEEKQTVIQMEPALDVPAAAISVSAATSASAVAGIDSAADIKTVDGTAVTSPLVGIFYAAPAEDAAPFVQVGDTVKKGQTLAIVEAMKLMNEIECECDGTVEEVLVQNGQAVEYGQPLFRIV